MADLSSEPVVDPRLRDYLDAELRRAELDFPHLPRPAAGRRARRVVLGPVLAALAGLALVALVAVVAIRVAPTPDPGSGAPRSSLIVSFTTQTDGAYGYAMLRPTNWIPGTGEFPDGRDYTAPGPFVDQAQGIVMHVVNLSLPKAALGSSDLWAMFEQHPTLADWTAGIEDRSLLGGSTMTLLRTLPEARIYSITNPAVTDWVFLAAYAVDQGQPLIVHLDAFGSDADLDRLEQEGLVDDLATMVASLRAVPPDATNLRPALPPASVDHPGPSTSVPAVATNPPSVATATIRTVDVSGKVCGGIGFNDGTLRGDPHDPRVAWLDLGSSGTMDLVFPKGFTARFTPRLEILDANGQVRFREGSAITGGCVWGEFDLLIGWP